MDEVDNLETHFEWLCPADLNNETPKDKIESVLKEIKMNPDIEVKALQVLAYLYVINNPPNIPKALELIDKSIVLCEDAIKVTNDPHLGYKFVALGNKVDILKKFNGCNQEIISTENRLKNLKPLPSKALAGVYGLKAYTMSLFGESKYLLGIDCFQSAIELDPSNFEWPMGLGIIAKRLRISEDGIRSLPTDMEEVLLFRSTQLSERKKPLPLLFLADLYFSQARGLKGEDSSETLMKTSLEFYMKAYELAPLSTTILKRCGKAFSVAGNPNMGEKFLLKGLELDETNSTILHRLGQLYEHSKPNLILAEKYYRLASAGRKRNVLADIDLGRTLKKQDKKYNLLNYYKEIRQHYLNNPKDLSFVESAIKRQEDYELSRPIHFKNKFKVKV